MSFSVSGCLSPPSPLVQVEHLSRAIGTHARKTVILDDVTFSVPAGSLFAINGPSGSGKSTLLNILTGIDRPTSGRVLFTGQELRSLSEDRLARWRGKHVGIVFQFFQLIPTLTALENVLLALELGGGAGLPRHQFRDRAFLCLELARIKHLAKRLPSELSGGEQQRVAIYSVLGTAFGLELGLVGGYQLASLLGSTVQLNVGSAVVALSAGPFQFSLPVLLVGVLVGLLVPQLAALWPLWTGTRITVREAMAAYGVRLGKDQANARAWGQRWQWVPQLVWLGQRGLFRRRGRTTFTLVALTLSGAIFFAVQMGNTSLGLAVTTEASPIVNPDVRVDLNASVGQTVTTLRSLSNVQSAVPITFDDAILGANRLFLTGVPADQYLPHLVAGRWLRPHEQGSIVLNEVAVQRLHLQVGGSIALTLNIGSQPVATALVHWTIVGLIHASDYVDGSADTQGTLGEAFVTPETLNGAIHRASDFADRIIIHARDHAPSALQQLQTQVTAVLTRLGQVNTQVRTLQQLDQGFVDPLPTIYGLFDAVSIVLAFIGLLSLALTLATSVLEHRLEIGVLRSIGATGWQVGTIFCIEGVALAGLAFALGLLVGLPGGVILIQVLGTFLGPLDTAISPLLVLNTLLFILIVALVASVGPALVASHMRISGILHYE